MESTSDLLSGEMTGIGRGPWDDPAFAVWIDRSDGAAPTIHVDGEVDLATIAAVREAIDDVLATGTRRLVLDFRGLTFLGSVGLRELVRAARHVDSIVIVDARPFVRKIFADTGLGGLVDFVIRG